MDETAVRAATSTNRVKSLRVSLFSMVFSLVVNSLKPLRLRGRVRNVERGDELLGNTAEVDCRVAAGRAAAVGDGQGDGLIAVCTCAGDDDKVLAASSRRRRRRP